jgi:hypothetical protein
MPGTDEREHEGRSVNVLGLSIFGALTTGVRKRCVGGSLLKRRWFRFLMCLHSANRRRLSGTLVLTHCGREECVVWHLGSGMP